MWARDPSLIELLASKLQPVGQIRMLFTNHPALFLVLSDFDDFIRFFKNLMRFVGNFASVARSRQKPFPFRGQQLFAGERRVRQQKPARMRFTDERKSFAHFDFVDGSLHGAATGRRFNVPSQQDPHSSVVWSVAGHVQTLHVPAQPVGTLPAFPIFCRRFLRNGIRSSSVCRRVGPLFSAGSARNDPQRTLFPFHNCRTWLMI